MDNYRITLELEGFPRDEGHVRLHVFLQQVQALATTIRQADIAVSGGRVRNTVRVVDLSHASPATLTLELVPINPVIDTRVQVITTLKKVQKISRSMEDAENLPRKLLEAVQRLVAPAGRQFLRGSLDVAGEDRPLNAELAVGLASLLAPDETEEGIVEGRLETINLHDGRNEFRIYPVVGPRHLICHFTDEKKNEAKAAIDRFVEVRGVLRFKAKAPFAYAVDVTNIELMPSESELPTLDELRGIAPDATNGVSSEDFIKDIRRGWS